jgi:hypothetical protein
MAQSEAGVPEGKGDVLVGEAPKEFLGRGMFLSHRPSGHAPQSIFADS